MPVVLFVSNDIDLARKVKSAIDSVERCQSRWINAIAELLANPLDESVCLVVVHASTDSDQGLVDSLLQKLCGLQPRVATVVIRDEFDGEADLRCLRMGLRECLTRPLDLGRLAYLIENLSLRSRLESARAAHRVGTDAETYSAASPVMQQLLKRAERIAARDVSVLLHGETGVGKTHLARWIHGASLRASRPFVSVNCGSLPANLIESELFGHKRGAFTGADENRVGKFAFVEDGTLLLDEVDALPLAAQAKLLRVLDEGIFEQVGSNLSVPFRGRLIAASNRSLEGLIETDQFRADLYYRLNIVQFQIPPLRDRVEEIPSLANSFVAILARKHGVAVPAIANEVWNVLERYPWPGNLRELRNAIEHALTHCEGMTIDLDELPAKFRDFWATTVRAAPAVDGWPASAILRQPRNALAQARQESEYRRILDVLVLCDNNRSQAARALGISRTALYKKLVSFGITRAFPESA